MKAARFAKHRHKMRWNLLDDVYFIYFFGDENVYNKTIIISLFKRIGKCIACELFK